MKRLILLLWLSFSCQNDMKSDSHNMMNPKNVKDMTLAQFVKHVAKSPIQSPKFWSQYLNTPLEERVFAATPEIIKFLQDDNDFNKFEHTPQKVSITSEYESIIKKAVKSLPPNVIQLIDKKVAGIIIVQDLGGSAITDIIQGFKNKGFMVFDIKTLTKNANEWCSWKENSPFRTGKLKIKCVIEKEEDNNKIGAFRYIFLHEIGHIINIGSNLVPFWTVRIKSKDDFNKYPYMNISWMLSDQNRYVRKMENKYLEKVVFYKPKKNLENESIRRVYGELQMSKFPTLYGSTNVWDDFAEGFVNYVHTQILNRPFKIEIQHEGKSVYSYKNCWNESRCKEKKSIFESLLGR